MFKFRLERVLGYRRLREKLLEQNLRAQQRQHDQEEAQLLSLQEDAQLIENRLSGSLGMTLFGEEVNRMRRRYQMLHERIATQKKVVSDISKAAEAARQELLEARRRKKILENLKVKAYQHHLRVEVQREQRSIDEFVISRSRYEL